MPTNAKCGQSLAYGSRQGAASGAAKFSQAGSKKTGEFWSESERALRCLFLYLSKQLHGHDPWRPQCTEFGLQLILHGMAPDIPMRKIFKEVSCR